MKRRREEAGFAMLLVFVLSAAIAISLFIEVPRIAFESQRAREQMAIDRGLQYQRAIQLFYRKYKLYPQNLDDLETTRNIRFLRHRYLDPLTGKEWRLLHVGAAGQLTDSLVQPAAPLPGSGTGSGQNSAQTAGPQQPTATAQPADPNNPNASTPDPLNMAARRPSDRVVAPAAEQPPASEPDPNQPQPTTDSSQPGQPGQAPAAGQIAGQIPGQVPGLFPGQATMPSQDPSQAQPNNAGQTTASGAAGGANSGAQQNQAANLIQQILTTPRQPPASVAGFTTGNTGGIAGVASTAEGKGIHVINDHTKYKEWEFVYDLKKDKTVVGAAAAAQQQQIQQQIQQNQNGGALGSSTTSTAASTANQGSTTTSPSAPPTTAPPSQ